MPPIATWASLLQSLMRTTPRQSDLRTGRVSIVNYVYHVTTATLHRRPVFSDFYAARALMRTLMQSDANRFTQTIACVIMPDHMHWLFTLEQDKTISSLMRTVKSLSAKKIGSPIWQKGFYDHAMRSEDNLQDTARYIVANPVRAGLVQKVADYPHWHAIYL